MKRLLLTLTSLALAAVALAQISGPGSIGGVGVQGNGLLTLNWVSQNYSPGQVYLACSEPANVADAGGVLTLTSLYTPSGTTCGCPLSCTGSPTNVTLDYTSANIFNPEGFTYGTFEARIEFPGAENHAAFWLQKTGCWVSVCQASDSDYREIDIAEVFSASDGNTSGDRVHVRQNVYGASNANPLFAQAVTSSDFTANFHIYKVNWTSTAMTFYVDGTQTHSINVTGDAWAQLPMNLYLSSLIDNVLSTPTPGDYPVEMVVDYVKHWDLSNNLDFDFEF